MATAFHSLINPEQYPLLAVVLSFVGLALMAWFLVYEMTTSKTNRKLFKELILAIFSSVILGLGLFFMLLWTGVYV